MNDELLVSICCITYNQEKYIRDALDSFLQQKTNFKYEIVIHDDASTDNTTNIIREYEKKYPHIIKTIYQTENQYRKGENVCLITYKKAKGKYIAVCEGDDFWIDENKLQMQVDYMEANPQCTFCFHNAKVIDEKNSTTYTFMPEFEEVKKYFKEDNKYDVGELELLEFIPTASFMFRQKYVSQIPDWFKNCFVGDWPIKMIMTSFGYAYYIDKEMSIYRKNAIGSVTVKNNKKEKDSVEGKIKILQKREQMINYMDDFTNGKYKEVFDLRRRQYNMERLIAKKQIKEILKKGYLKNFNNKQKLKYLIKICCPKVVELYKNRRDK